MLLKKIFMFIGTIELSNFNFENYDIELKKNI